MPSLFPVVFKALARLPLPLLHNLGAFAGWLAWLLSATYRRNFSAHIVQAGLTKAKAAAIAEAGKALLELPKIWLRPQAEVVERIAQVSGWDLVEAAWEAKRGILFLTPHLGCFEITAQYYAARKPMTVLYRRPKQDWLVPLIEQGRGANLKLAPADLSGVRRLLKALKGGEAVGMLPDQVPGNGEGAWLPFFGRPAYTMTLAARLAETGATVLLAYAERLHYGAGYHLKLFPLSAPLQGDLMQRAAQLNRELEALIRQCPEQYLWGYNRYKVPAGATPPPSDRTGPAKFERSEPVSPPSSGRGRGGRRTGNCIMTRVLLVMMWFLHWLPLPLLAVLGRGLGLMLYALVSERRHVTLTNIGLCFPHLSPPEQSALARRHFAAFGRSILELGLWWWASPERIRRLVRLEGAETLAAHKGKPVILLVPHFVGIDAGWIRLALEHGLVAMYTRQKNRVFEAAMNDGRLRFGNCALASRQEGTRRALKAMKAGRFFHYSPDMDYGPKESVFVPFFGVQTATITGLARLAKLTGATVIPVLTRMEGRGWQTHYVATVGEPWADFPGDGDVGDARRLNAFIEAEVLKSPEQYYWLHKRFKTRPPEEKGVY